MKIKEEISPTVSSYMTWRIQLCVCRMPVESWWLSPVNRGTADSHWQPLTDLFFSTADLVKDTRIGKSGVFVNDKLWNSWCTSIRN